MFCVGLFWVRRAISALSRRKRPLFWPYQTGIPPQTGIDRSDLACLGTRCSLLARLAGCSVPWPIITRRWLFPMKFTGFAADFKRKRKQAFSWGLLSKNDEYRRLKRVLPCVFCPSVLNKGFQDGIRYESRTVIELRPCDRVVTQIVEDISQFVRQGLACRLSSELLRPTRFG